MFVEINMKLFVRLIKVLAILVCLAFFFILTFDVIIKFHQSLTTTVIQIYNSDEANNFFMFSGFFYATM